MSRFQGKVALVTGGASGIGKATALRIAREGGAVVVADIQDAAGAAVVGEIEAAGGRAIYQRLDVASEESWEAASAALKKSGNGSVVNVSSMFGIVGGFGTSPAYHAAKGAVRLLTKSTALAWVKEGVRVNSARACRGDRGRDHLPRQRRRVVRHRIGGRRRRRVHRRLTRGIEGP